MKVLTLHQPWATAITQGLKHYETRPRRLKHRGPLAIHAGKKMVDPELVNQIRSNLPFSHRYSLPNDFDYGCIVAVTDMTDCLEMTPELISSMNPLEKLFGDWQEGRFAYKLENVRILKEPLVATGSQGLWNIDDELLFKHL